jgi:cell division protein FtsI/penicillin-binding protein 2
MRFQVIKLIYIGMFSLILLRLFYWQIVQGDMLTAKAESQRFLTKEMIAPRGEIQFSDGSVLVSSEPAYTLFAQPRIINQSFLPKTEITLENLQSQDMEKIIRYKKDAALKLAELFKEEDKKLATQTATIAATPEEEKVDLQERQDYFFNLLNKDLFWVNLNRKVDNSLKRRIEDFSLTGLGFDSGTKRFYPEGSSSAHIMGFVGSDEYGEDIGYGGVEGYYNGELKGKPGSLTQEKDALGLPILIGQFTSKDPKPGKTLKLHIDRAIQRMVESSLQKGMVRYGAKGASAVIMDPKDGAILAMASYPSYDPTKSWLYPRQNLRNPLTADAYEPGSTFKVLVMAAGINEGLVTPETKCDICNGPLKVADYTIRTWNNKYQENPTMTDVIIHSDNTGMVYVGRKMGQEKLFDYIRQFGFGSVTGVDLQDEQSPDIRPLKDWKEIDLATATFGQGISVTGLQLVRAVAAIANGGVMYEPHIVDTITDGEKKHVIAPRVIGNPLKPETTKQVTEMMIQAVDQGESQFYKKKAGIENYQIAGKTGTAQIPVAGHYDATKTIASFIGFAPANDPKFVMLVRYDQPTSSIYGADTAAPTFFEITKELFTYYGIPPSVQAGIKN